MGASHWLTPTRHDAVYFLTASFEKQNRMEQNRAFLNDRLIVLSRYLEDMAVDNPKRYRLIEQAYVRWSLESGYGEDLSRLDASNDWRVRQVLIDIARFTQAARPAKSRTPFL